jgi:type II secretory pathway component PulM
MATTLRLPALERWTQWWRLRTATERAAWTAIAALLTMLVAWLVIVQPAARDAERLARQVAAQRVTLAQAHRQSDEIAGRAQNDAPLPPRDVRPMLDAALARQGLKAAIDRVDDRRIRLTFDAVQFGALTALLDDLQRTARIRPVDLNATARVEPAQVRAELTITSD